MRCCGYACFTGYRVAKLLLKRKLGGWEEADDESREAARKFKVAETYRATIVKPRALVSLRRYWGLVNLVLHNTEQFESKDQLHQYLKLRARHATPIVSKTTGEVFMVPNSIDFDTLDETQFQEVWSRVIDVVCEEILPGITEDEINLELQRYMGLAR
jgi:hypothetical protein